MAPLLSLSSVVLEFSIAVCAIVLAVGIVLVLMLLLALGGKGVTKSDQKKSE